jgi:transposase InsO family protein
MTTEHKVALVDSVWETYGLEPALAAANLPKSTWYYQRNQKVAYEDKYADVLAELEEIARDHPEYGYRRTTVELRDTYDRVVNHKVVQRLFRAWDLCLARSVRPPKPSGIRQAIVASGERANLVAQLDHIELFEVAYTDFTELVYADGRRKAHLLPIVDHVCKMVYGWAVGEHDDTALALRAWQRAKQTFQQLDIPYAGMIVHHDQDAVFTGYEWARQLIVKDGVRLSFTLRGFKDNPEMESFNGRFKEENRSLLLEAQTLDELMEVVDQRMDYHNVERRHSSIGYVSPVAYIERVRSGLEE